MQNTRRLRLQAVIQEELSILVSRELKDPRVPPLSLTSVEVAHDGSQATVFVSILKGLTRIDPNMKECLEGLDSASGFLRKHLGSALKIRHIPKLIFKEDKGFENLQRVQALLKGLETKDQ